MKRRGLFITGTDTGVGKTWVGAQLASQLCASGVPVVPRKTVESGCTLRDGELIPADGEAYHEAIGARCPLQQITPFRLRHAISPQRAAQLEGVDTALAKLIAATFDSVTATDYLLVEGAGGFYSPLALDGLNADFAVSLQLPVLLIAPDRLGVINHVLLSKDAIEHRGLRLMAVVLNQLDDDSPAGMDNLADLQSLSCPVYRLTHAERLEPNHPLVQLLIAAA